LVLFEAIKDLDNQDLVVKRIQEEIKICISPQKVLLSLETIPPQNLLETSKNKKLTPQKPKKKNLWDDFA
jgi:hypothetical protein